VAAIEETSPAWASLVTSRTPVRPRAVRSRKKASQPAPSSLVVTWTPRISRCPSALIPGRHQAVHRHDAAALADLEDQCVGGQEGEWPGVGEGSGAELLDVGVELLGHRRDLGLREPGDTQGLHQLVHPPRADPEQVAGGHHAGQRLLGTGAPLE
jgi:hypothetical protein